MRYLSKIIFINSAATRYSEVRLDGNIHFIGTQGVGKSTVLRAILFFYNADKQRLGIPREKKSFDEFYLPHSNSYIIYEVQTEMGAFCVMTFRHMARAAFRFIDAPYHQRWFVDENGEVTSESPVIRSRLGGRAMTRIVEHYDEYRDILYGNRGAVGKEFARYALMQSQRYDNIPRSITNVFLNSKVDADFIKDIIIRSMEEDEPGIDLAYYRLQVSEFENEFADIGLWFKKDRQGRVPVRLKADEIVERYHRLLYLEGQIRDDAGELQYAVKDAQERIPLLKKSLEELKDKEMHQREKLDEIAQKFDSERTALNKGIAVAEEHLRITRKKRRHYEEIGIDAILQRASKEEVQKIELSERKRRMEVLTGASDDIKMKYDRLRITLQKGQQKFYELQQKRKDELRTAKNARLEELLADRDRRKREAEERFKASIDEKSEQLHALEKRCTEVGFSLSSLASHHPLEAEISQAEGTLRALELELSGVEGSIKALSAQEDRMRSALEIQQHIAELKDSLEKARTSLVEFISACGVDNDPSEIVDEAAIRQKIAALEAALEESHADLKAVRELHQQKGVLEVRAGVLPNKIKALKLSAQELREKEKAMLEASRAELEAESASLSKEREQADEQLKNLKVELKRQISSIVKSADEAIACARRECDEQIAVCDEALRQRTHELNRNLDDLERQKRDELRGRGVDMEALSAIEKQISALEAALRQIEGERQTIFNYTRDREEYFDIEERTKGEKEALEMKLSGIATKYEARRAAAGAKLQQILSESSLLSGEISSLEDGVRRTSDFLAANASSLPQAEPKMSLRTCSDILDGLRNSILERQEALGAFKQSITVFTGLFVGDTFHFRQELTLDADYMEFASSLSEFLLNDKIEAFRQRTSERYVEILSRVSREMGDVTRHVSEVGKLIREINYDFKEKNFVGAIKSIELRSVASSDPMVQLFLSIKAFSDEHQFVAGEANLFNCGADGSSSEDVSARAVGYLRDLMVQLQRDPSRISLTLSDTFQLQFRVVENDNDTLWVEKIASVGSDGTDILVKAMVNIMLINVFKEKVSRKGSDFRIHCMMDEIGKLHPSNVKGILDFANARNILLVNSSPTTYNVAEYRHTYLLSKDSDSKTLIRPLITRKEEAVGTLHE